MKNKLEKVKDWCLIIICFLLVVSGAYFIRNYDREMICKVDVKIDKPNLEKDCDKFIDWGYANGVTMVGRVLGECHMMNDKDGILYGADGYRDNPNCDAEKIINDMWDANIDEANWRP